MNSARAEATIATKLIITPRWSTSSFSQGAQDSSLDLSLLGEHLNHCRGAHGRLFTMQCVAEALNGFVSARLVTTLVLAALLIGLASIAL